MAIPVLIIGKSGSGKSSSLRTVAGNDRFNLINVIGKPLPFKGKVKGGVTDDYEKVKEWLYRFSGDSIVLDDAGYLITNMFMKGHATAGQGNAIFTFYNKIGDQFWKLIEFIKSNVPANKIVYVMMHEDTDDFGNVKPKTIGKMLDEKVCLEGMFTIVLRCVTENGNHYFLTQTNGTDVAKTPMGMFQSVKIDNDILLVDKTIREYYELETNREENKDAN
jgi:hypothetical protein